MNAYAGRRVLVTGGLGFLGSNLSIELVRLGADVTIVDAMVAGCGGNYRNIDTIAGKVDVIEADVGDSVRVRHLLKNINTIFNVAGEVSKTHSMVFPDRDLAWNTSAQMNFLPECADQAKGVRVVYAGTRRVYGKPLHLPVDESHPVAPVDFNGIHKRATEQYHLLLTRAGFLDAVVLRLTNIYGPRLGINVTCQGVLNAMFQQLVLGESVEVYGDGSQLRDPLYVDDAVNAMLRAGSEPRLKSRVYNVGGSQALTMAQIACTLCTIAGAPPPKVRRFPPERSLIEIGSFVSDCRLIRRELGWAQSTSFVEGAEATLRYLRAHWREYVDPSGRYPSCRHCMPEVTGTASGPAPMSPEESRSMAPCQGEIQ